MTSDSQQSGYSLTTDITNCKEETPANSLGNQWYGDWSMDLDTQCLYDKNCQVCYRKMSNMS